MSAAIERVDFRRAKPLPRRISALIPDWEERAGALGPRSFHPAGAIVECVGAPRATVSLAEHLGAKRLLTSMPAPRAWLLGTELVRGAYHLSAADGGTGKTAVALAWALSLATGRGLAGLDVHMRSRVLMISGEDGKDEMARRLAASLQAHRLTAADTDGWLFLAGASDIPKLSLTFTDPALRGEYVVNEPAFRYLEMAMREVSADVLILDPLTSFMPSGVNDNALASGVAARLVKLLIDSNAAGMLVHHQGKAAIRAGEGSTAAAAMGAVGWTNHARMATALTRVTYEDAARMGWRNPPEELRYVVRLTNSKANLAPKADDRYYQMIGVSLGNGTPDYPNGDIVHAAIQFVPKQHGSAFREHELRAALITIASGSADGGPLSGAANATTHSARKAVAAALRPSRQETEPKDLARMASMALTELTALGWLAEETFRMPRQGGKGGAVPRQGLVVQWERTPWGSEPPPGPHARGSDTPE